MRNILNQTIVVAGCWLVLLAGCAPIEHQAVFIDTGTPKPERSGIYHKVRRGETLFRISRAYAVSLQDIVMSNKIPDVGRIEENQLIFIPGAYAPKEIVAITSEQSNDEFIWPLKGRIVHYYNQRDKHGVSKGIDIQTAEGEVVRASRGGRVVFADKLSGYGYTVILDHGAEFQTVYAHNAKVLVSVDEVVRQGNAIAHVGRMNNRSMLHFQVRKDAVDQNPLYFLPAL